MSYETETSTITLAGKSYPVHALTFDQFQIVQKALNEAKKTDTPDVTVARSRLLIETALTGPDGMTKEDFAKNVRVVFTDLQPAVSTIVAISGMQFSQANPEGEQTGVAPPP